MVFRVPKIKTCCCCASLKTGTYIVAGLDVLSFVAALCFAVIHPTRPATFNQVLVYDTVFLNVGAFSFVLLYGIIKKDHTLMFPWILQQTIFVLFLLNYLLGSILYLGLMDERTEEMTVEVFGVVITGYALLVVYNYYRELKETTAEETN